jgi:hypothetical protein
VHLELRLQLPDPLAGRGELLTLPGSQAGDEAAIDLVLTAPGVDRLVADPEVTREVGCGFSRVLATRFHAKWTPRLAGNGHNR